MNIYMLVEGRRTEKRVYKSWFSTVLPSLQVVNRLEDLAGQSLFLLSGNGYPSYRDRIIRSLQDITRHGRVDLFVVCVDAENMSRHEKLTELAEIASSAPPFAKTRFVVHDCCIETWLLGNQKVVSRNPQSEELRQFLRHFDVTSEDPEAMPLMKDFRTRAQHHYSYLRAAFRERGLAYTKTNPGCACDASYFREIAKRCAQDGHISSLSTLLEVLGEIGTELGVAN